MTDIAYAFQEVVANRILDHRDIILQAPTGAGKTRAALQPGLEGFNSESIDAYPQRIIYGVPMRVLARSFQDEHKKIAVNKGWEKEWEPRIQTGELPEDPLFEGKLIFATADQILASFLMLPYGIPARLDNINTGAMIGSYLIFDEFHLYPRNEMMLTVLAMLKMLKGITRFVLMSATFSKLFLEKIAKVLDAELIADTAGDGSLFSDVTSVQTQTRTWTANDGVLDADAVLALHGQRTICICNTVERAQALYKALQNRLPDGTECRLLHSRFFHEDRRETEDWVKRHFGQKDEDGREWLEDKRNKILIATQVIEVGLDISCHVMLTECAPAASLIQRAGRCARRRDSSGTVYVFQPYDADGMVNYSPYGNDSDDDQLKDVCECTWEALVSEEFNGRVLRFAEEQQLVNIAHGPSDTEFVENLESKVDARIAEIIRCMANRDSGFLDALIRKHTSVPLYIHTNPNSDTILTSKPWERESFSLSRGQIGRLFKELEEHHQDDDLPFWLCASSGQPDKETDEEDGDAQPSYKWDKLQTSSEVYSRGNRWFVAHPQAVAYDPPVGLVLKPGGALSVESRMVEAQKRKAIGYTADTYVQHVSLLHKAYTSWIGKIPPLYREFAYPLCRLCEAAGMSVETGERMMRLALALHDVGKLNIPWQAWVQDWQRYYRDKGYALTIEPDGTPLAHSDREAYTQENAEVMKALQKGFKHRPRGTHAVESAEACLAVLKEAAGEEASFWLPVVIAAIARHHTPDAYECGAFDMGNDPHTRDALVQALVACGFEAEAEDWCAKVKGSFPRSSTKLAKQINKTIPSEHEHPNYRTLAYYLFVRILRLADQRATEESSYRSKARHFGR